MPVAHVCIYDIRFYGQVEVWLARTVRNDQPASELGPSLSLIPFPLILSFFRHVEVH